MSTTPFWFGPADRPLFGWAHVPAGGHARGGVVLCPPLGIEAICAYFTLRALAERLAEAGLATVRFDYDGTGDSAGEQFDPDRVAAWSESVRHALDVVGAFGVSRVAVVGMRMGALLAAREASRRGGVDGLVLWDPCVTGRSFLREQQALRMVSIGGNDESGAVDAPGMRFEPEAVAEMRELNFLRLEGRLAPSVLVAESQTRPGASRLADRLAGAGADVERIEAIGQEALLDPQRQEPAWATVDRVTEWLGHRFGSDVELVHLDRPSRAVVARTDGGDEVIEHSASFGTASLFGIVTEPGRRSPSSPTVVFVNEGNTPHIGQSRLWVELARAWAQAGLRVLRFDLSGNGDSGVHPGQQAHVAWAPEALGDVVDAVRFASPDDPQNVVLVGLCAGAYLGVEVSLTLAPLGLCLINPVLSFLPPEGTLARPEVRRARQGTQPVVELLARQPVRWMAKRHAPLSSHRWEIALDAGTWPTSVSSRLPWIPEAAWRLANRILIKNHAAGTLESVVHAGTKTYLVCGEEDLLPLSLGAGHVFERLQESSAFALEVLGDLDHAGLIPAQRQLLKETLTAHVTSTYASESQTG